MRKIQRWLAQYPNGLADKQVALFGASGGLGSMLCRYILQLGGRLIMVDRSPAKAERLANALQAEYPRSSITRLTADLQDLAAIEAVCQALENLAVDVVIHNAGAYSIPRATCASGYNNVFQINFAAPYHITCRLLPHLCARGGVVVMVGSIAHRYSATDPNDVDFSTRRASSLVYGNAKRYLMFATQALAQQNPGVRFAITHPGVTFTNITAHYPKWLFALIKYPMKVLFMPPKYAALNILQGVFTPTAPGEWIGPAWFDLYGRPTKKKLKPLPPAEAAHIVKVAAQADAAMQYPKPTTMPAGGPCHEE